MKKILIFVFIAFMGLQFAGAQEKSYHITAFRKYELWQDSKWLMIDSGDDIHLSCHVFYDKLGIWGKFVMEEKMYHLYGELQKMEVNVDSLKVTYHAKGKLVYDNIDVKMTYWETYHQLDSIDIVSDNARIVLKLEEY